MLRDLGNIVNNNSRSTLSLEKSVKSSRFQKYIELVENNYRRHDSILCAKILIGLIVEYLNYKEVLQAIEIEGCPEDNSSIESVYYQLEQRLNLKPAIIAIEEVHKDDEKAYRNVVLLNKPSIEVSVNDVPILLNPWNRERILDNFIDINNSNVFNGAQYSFNIENYYLHPMGIVVCRGGNHSQLAAKYKNKGITIINRIIDFTKLYNMVEFNGNEYVQNDGEVVSALSCSENILFYSGIIFELGRYLKDKNCCDVKKISAIVKNGIESMH